MKDVCVDGFQSSEEGTEECENETPSGEIIVSIRPVMTDGLDR